MLFEKKLNPKLMEMTDYLSYNKAKPIIKRTSKIVKDSLDTNIKK